MEIVRNGIAVSLCISLCVTAVKGFSTDGLIHCQGRRYELTREPYLWNGTTEGCKRMNGILAPHGDVNSWTNNCPELVNKLHDSWKYLVASPPPNDCGVLFKDVSGPKMSTQPHDSPACPLVGRLICEVTNEGKTTAPGSCRANCTDKPTGPSIKDHYFKLVGTGVSPPPKVTTISHVTTGSPRLCGVECLKRSACGSFLLNPGSTQCLLYAGNHSSTLVQGSIDMKYFVKYKKTV